MPLYSYKAAKANGEMFDGEQEADNEATLVARLQADGLIPIKITVVSKAAGFLRFSSKGAGKRLSNDQILHFTQELATLLEAGLTLDRALQILRDLTDDEQLAIVMENIREKVHSGSTLSEAFESQGDDFTPLYVNMIRAGEAGGVMDKVLLRLADYLERSQELRESVRSALMYPIILLVVAGLSVIMLLMFVVPQFSQMFADMGQALPTPTRIVIGIGDVFRDYWWLLLGSVLLFVAWVQAQLQKPEVKARWDKRVLRWPLFGDLVAKVEAARFARTLSTLLDNGLPLLSALALVKNVISNSVIREHITNAADSLKHGKGFAEPLIAEEALPPLALQMIKVGEESGNLGPMLTKVANIYDQEVRNSVKRMLTLLEPILIVGLGLVVAGIIISILMAVLSANQLAF